MCFCVCVCVGVDLCVCVDRVKRGSRGQKRIERAVERERERERKGERIKIIICEAAQRVAVRMRTLDWPIVATRAAA